MYTLVSSISFISYKANRIPDIVGIGDKNHYETRGKPIYYHDTPFSSFLYVLYVGDAT